jgi:hypothetical protein
MGKNGKVPRRKTGYAVRSRISQAQARDAAMMRREYAPGVIRGAEARETIDPDSPRIKVSLAPVQFLLRPMNVQKATDHRVS